MVEKHRARSALPAELYQTLQWQFRGLPAAAVCLLQGGMPALSCSRCSPDCRAMYKCSWVSLWHPHGKKQEENSVPGRDHLPDGRAQTVSCPLANLAAVILELNWLWGSVQIKNNRSFFGDVGGQGLDPGCCKAPYTTLEEQLKEGIAWEWAAGGC